MLRPTEPNREPAGMSGVSTPRIMGKSDVDASYIGASEFRQNTDDPADEGPMASKISQLKQQVAALDDEIFRGTKDKSVTRDELGRIIERKAEIEKTLELLGGAAIKAVVKKRDSMDLSRKASIDARSDSSDDAPEPPSCEEPLRLFSMPSRQFSIDDIGLLQSSTGQKERHFGRRATMFTGVTDQSGSFHASDYLFMSSDSFTSPSSLNLSATSRRNLSVTSRRNLSASSRRNLSVTSRVSFRHSNRGQLHVGGGPLENKTTEELGKGIGKSIIHEDVGPRQKSEPDVKHEEPDQMQGPPKHGRRSSIAASFTSMFSGLSAEAATNNDDTNKTCGRTYSIG